MIEHAKFTNLQLLCYNKKYNIIPRSAMFYFVISMSWQNSKGFTNDNSEERDSTSFSWSQGLNISIR